MLEGVTPMNNALDAQNNTFTSTMNVPGGLSTLRSHTIDGIAEVPESPSPIKDQETPNKDENKVGLQKSVHGS